MLFALVTAVAAQGVTFQAPPVAGPVHRDVIISRHGRFAHPGRYQVIRRGGFVPSYFAHPGFTVVQPRAYGFRQPIGGTRWIRYHDDALLVDGYGRVHDGRYGHDWRRHGRDWGRDRHGIPVYVGDGDFFPEDRDYRWAERMERDEDGELAYDRDYPYDLPYGAEVADEGAYGYATGCEAGCDGGYTVTETTVTFPTTYREVTTYEDVVEHRRPVRRVRTKTLRR